MSLKKQLNLLIKRVEILGLPEADLITASEYLKYNEYGLCFDTIITQMYELEIAVNVECYILIKEIANQMQIEEQHYGFMKELITQP